MKYFQTHSNIPKSNYLEPYDLSNHHDLEQVIEIFCDDIESGYFLRWEAIDDYGDDLPLPEGISIPINVVPATTRHKLWIQWCFSVLEGIGQTKEINLEEQFYRIENFIDILKDCQDSVEYLQLTLKKLLTILIIPPKDQGILVDTIIGKLKIPSSDHSMADYL